MIRNGSVWFSSARHFNDPFDTAITHSTDRLYEPVADEWARRVVARECPSLSAKDTKKMADELLAELRQNPSLFEKRKDEITNSQYDKFGICSFSAVKDNLLLWAHYADRHRGTCIGFDTKRIIDYSDRVIHDRKELLDLRPARYQNDYPKHDLFTTNDMEDISDIEDLIYTKAADWAYEMEFRLVYWGRKDFAVELGVQAISEVILGCRVSLEHRDKVICAYSSLSEPPKVFQTKKDKDSFRLQLDRLI